MQTRKEFLRQQMRAKLGSMSREVKASRSNLIQIMLSQNASYKEAKHIALYASTESEVLMTDVIEDCFERSKKVYLPACVSEATAGRRTKHMKLYRVPGLEHFRSMTVGKYGIREPREGIEVMTHGDLDLVIVPGLAFSPSGKRLGQGAGYYDEFLSAFEKKFEKRPKLIGVAFSEQLHEEIPQDEHDWTVDEVLFVS